MKLKIKEAINSCGSGATQLSNIGAYKRDSIDMLPKNVRRKPRPKDFEVDLDEGYDNPFTNAKQKKAFDDACDCIHNGYGKMYWKKNYRNGLDVSQIDEIWNKAYKYMNESVKRRKVNESFDDVFEVVDVDVFPNSIHFDFAIDGTTYRAVVDKNAYKVVIWRMYDDSEGFEWWDECYKPEGISEESVINYLKSNGYLNDLGEGCGRKK